MSTGNKLSGSVTMLSLPKKKKKKCMWGTPVWERLLKFRNEQAKNSTGAEEESYMVHDINLSLKFSS